MCWCDFIDWSGGEAVSAAGAQVCACAWSSCDFGFLFVLAQHDQKFLLFSAPGSAVCGNLGVVKSWSRAIPMGKALGNSVSLSNL